MFRPRSLCCPPRSSLPLRVLPQGSRGFYVRAERASLPPHAPDMLTVRTQAIDGTRTFTSLDPQPCRLLNLCQRPSPARPWVGFPLHSANTTFRGGFFEAADIPLCSGLPACSLSRSFLPLRIPPPGSQSFYVRAYRALLPPHAPEMLTV